MNTYISVLSYDLKKRFLSTVYVCEVSSVLRNEVTDNNNRFGMYVNDRVCVCVCVCVFCECIIVMQLTTVYIQSSTTYVTCCTSVSSRLFLLSVSLSTTIVSQLIVERGSSVVECRTRNRQSPRSNLLCYCFEVWECSFCS